jgi:hypothetical protein
MEKMIMKFIQYANLPMQTRGINHRVGTFEFWDLGQGQPGDPANFYLRIVQSYGDFFSPRHRHNFDQLRLQLRGKFGFASDGVMEPGCIGYFPEGTLYGPQTSAEDTLQLVLQIGGPSGDGYVSEEERVAAVDALIRNGRFERGHYYASTGGSTVGVDGFEAVWEYARQHRMCYPKPRFAKPLLAYPDAFEWVDVNVDGRSGARRKTIWNFGSRTLGCEMLALDLGAVIDLQGPLSCFVQSGTGVFTGMAQQLGYAEFDTLHLELGESIRIEAKELSSFLALSHPRFPEKGGVAGNLATTMENAT